MLQILNTLRTSFYLLLVVGIIGVAFATTLTLSPVTPSDVAGESTADSKVLSNYFPILLQDTSTPNPRGFAQLLETGLGNYLYAVNLASSSNANEVEFGDLVVINKNASTIKAQFALSVPTEIAASVFVTISDGNEQRVLSSPSSENHGVMFEIGPNSQSNFTLRVSTLQPLMNESKLNLQIKDMQV